MRAPLNMATCNDGRLSEAKFIIAYKPLELEFRTHIWSVARTFPDRPGSMVPNFSSATPCPRIIREHLHGRTFSHAKPLSLLWLGGGAFSDQSSKSACGRMSPCNPRRSLAKMITRFPC